MSIMANTYRMPNNIGTSTFDTRAYFAFQTDNNLRAIAIDMNLIKSKLYEGVLREDGGQEHPILNPPG
jgi:hypothetical protein